MMEQEVCFWAIFGKFEDKTRSETMRLGLAVLQLSHSLPLLRAHLVSPIKERAKE